MYLITESGVYRTASCIKHKPGTHPVPDTNPVSIFRPGQVGAAILRTLALNNAPFNLHFIQIPLRDASQSGFKAKIIYFHFAEIHQKWAVDSEALVPLLISRMIFLKAQSFFFSSADSTSETILALICILLKFQVAEVIPEWIQGLMHCTPVLAQ